MPSQGITIAEAVANARAINFTIVDNAGTANNIGSTWYIDDITFNYAGAPTATFTATPTATATNTTGGGTATFTATPTETNTADPGLATSTPTEADVFEIATATPVIAFPNPAIKEGDVNIMFNVTKIAKSITVRL